MINYNGFILADEIGGPCAKQTGLFSPYHEKHYLTLTVTSPAGVKSTYKTTFQFNPASGRFKDNDGLYCIIQDAFCFYSASDLTDFSNEYDYKSAAAARNAFNGCRRAYKFLTAAGLTPDDLQNITDIMEGF